MPLEQDPLDKYKIKTESNDPLDRYKPGSVIKPEVENIEPVEIKAKETSKAKEEPKEESWWNWLTRSRAPEKLSSKGTINYENKSPFTVGQRETGAEPDTYAGGFAKGLQESLYENVARPMASPLGAAIIAGGAPLVRGALGVASKIPGVSKVGQLLAKEILPGEAPAFVKETVSALTPKGKVTTPVDTPELASSEINVPKIVRPEKPDYTNRILEAAGEGKPGLSDERLPKTNNMPGDTRVLTYRNPDGKPIISVRFAESEDGQLIINDFVADKSKGLLRGKAMNEVINALKGMNVNLDWTETMTPDAKNLLDKYKLMNASPIDKLLGAVRETKPLEQKQAKIYSVERGSRISEAEKVTTPGQKGFFEKKSKLAGEHTKVQMEPLKLEQPDIDSLFDDISKSSLEPFQRINAGDGLQKILNGEVPQNSEIQLLGKIFGQDKISELASKLPKIKQGDLIHEALNIPRAMQTIWDLSMPLRQGKGLIMSRDWFRAWPSMVKSAGSEGAYRGVMDSIMSHPNFRTVIKPDGTKEIPFFRKAGLHLTDLTDLSSREESMMSTVVEQAVPLARASNRAATAYVNKLRADHFNRLIASAEKAGLDPKNNLGLAQRIAGFVNNATGRGSLGSAEKYAVALNDIFFSPRFLASRVNMLNPANYMRLNTPEGRMVSKQYWKSMAGLSAAWLTELSLMQASGAEVNWDPTSSDFGKARWGQVTFDPGAGFQQPIVLLARLAQGSYKTMTGNEREYGHGFGSKTMKDAIEDFLANKLAPIPKYFYDVANSSEYQPFDVNDRTVRLLTPMIMQDLSELAQEDPSLLPLLGGAFAGESIQVNNPDLKMFGDMIPPSNIPVDAGPGFAKARKGR